MITYGFYRERGVLKYRPLPKNILNRKAKAKRTLKKLLGGTMKTKKAMFVFLAFITTMPVHAKQSIDPNVEAQIQLMLKHNNQVRLMVLPGKPAHVTTSRENNRAMATVNAFSARLMNQFAKNPNFQLIERVQIEALLGEIHFQYTGAVESNSVQEIGRLSGTTHILIVDVADNYVSRKLVEIKTGRVLAISNDVFKS